MRKKTFHMWKKYSILLGVCLFAACGKADAGEAEQKLTPTVDAGLEDTGKDTPDGEDTGTENKTPTPQLTKEPTPTGVPLSKEEIVKRLEAMTEQPVAWISCEDYNGDGVPEGFALVGEAGADYWGEEEPNEDGTYETYYGEIWYVSENGAVKLREEYYYLCPEVLTIAGERFQKFEALYASDSQSYLYQVTEDGAKNILPGIVQGISVLENGIIEAWQSAYDISSDGTGHTWKPYYFYYEDGLKEYGGIEIDEELFRQYANADNILDPIYAAGGRVTEILYFLNNRFYVNYQLPSDFGMDAQLNYYIEVCPDETAPFYVTAVPNGTEEGIDWTGMIELGAYCREGVYQSALFPEIAGYPAECTSPEAYYTEQYAGRKPSDLEFRLYTGEVVLTGEDIEGISDRNLLISLTDEFLNAAAQRIANTDASGIYGVRRLLGITENGALLKVFIGDEMICSMPTRDYMSYETEGFMTYNGSPEEKEQSSYTDKLVMMKPSADLTEVKLHAFAKAAGLLKEAEPVKISEQGVYATDQEYLVDLNGDGVPESLYYGQRELVIDGVNYFGMMKELYYDYPEVDSFCLLDLDKTDGVLELGIWAHGPSNDDWTRLFWYDGETLHKAGDLPGMDITLGTSWRFDGAGSVTLPCRLSILQTWWADMTYVLYPKEHVLEQLTQEMYSVTDGMQDREYTLVRSIRLYEEPDISGAYTVLEPQLIKLPATDNCCFVRVEAADGMGGYMYLEDGQIQLADGSYEDWSNPAISDLIYAD